MTMADRLMYILNDDTQKLALLSNTIETFGHSTNELTHQNIIKVYNDVKPTNKKTLLINLWN